MESWMVVNLSNHLCLSLCNCLNINTLAHLTLIAVTHHSLGLNYYFYIIRFSLVTDCIIQLTSV